MNILILSWRGPGHPHEGGAEVSTHNHAKGWVKAGHNVTLFTSYYPGARQEEKIDGVLIKRCGSQNFGVHWEAFKWYLFGNHLKYDLVVDEFHGIPFFTPIYVREKKLAFIHEITKEVWALNPWPFPLNLIPAFIGRIFEPLIFQLFYRNIPFMTGAQSAKDDLILWGIPEKNITIIHHGFDKPKKIDFSKSEKMTIIFLGALSKDKGIEDALQVFSILSITDWDFRFWVIGKGEEHYFRQLQLQAYKMGLKDKIKFWGFVSNNKKFELLAKAYLLVNPSVREGWGLVVIEAASVGTPTVGYNVAGLKDSIVNGKTGILCDKNPKACTEAILGLVENREKYQLFKKNCLQWCRRFSWEKSADESLKLIEELVDI